MATTTAMGGFGDGQGPSQAMEEDFFDRVGALARKLGKSLVEKVLVAYFVARDPATPLWAKSALVSALVYLGLPLDAVPDVIPVAGFADDAAAIAFALASVVTCIRWRHVTEARDTMRAWGFKIKTEDHGHDPDGQADGFDG